MSNDAVDSPPRGPAPLPMVGQLDMTPSKLPTSDEIEELPRVMVDRYLFRIAKDFDLICDHSGNIRDKVARDYLDRFCKQIKRDAAKKTTDGKDTPKKTLSFFVKGGMLYLDVLTQDHTFEFVHEHDGDLIFEATVFDDLGQPIEPCKLPIHHDTGTMIFVVGLPRADLLREVPVMDPETLYSMMEDHINRYADLPDLEREIGIYYALYSWMYPKCMTSPYLRFIGDTGKGKSRILEVISDLCFYPIKATGSSSTSGIMRFHERWKGTLVIDESDLRGGAEDPLVKFLNTGFEQNKYLILSDKNDPNRQQIFNPFGPKVIAMREPFKDNATEGRCISYSPTETTRKDIPPELSARYHEEVAELRAYIARFVLHHWKNVNGDAMIEITDLDVERRLLQMARPVSVVLQLFPGGKERFMTYIRKRQIEIRRTRAESWEGMLFNYTLSFARGETSTNENPPEAVIARDIADVFGLKANAVTRGLNSIGFAQESDHIRIIRGGVSRRISIRKLVVPSKSVWEEITRRYYHSADDLDTPPCPAVLKGKGWDHQETMSALFSESVPIAPTVPAVENTPSSGTEGAHGADPIHRTSGDEDATDHDVTTTAQSYCIEGGLNTIPDLVQYRRITTPKTGRCIFKGCTRPMIWEDANGYNYLCDEHYTGLRALIERTGEGSPCP